MVWEVFEAVSRGHLSGMRTALHTGEASSACVSRNAVIAILAYGWHVV